MANINDYMSWRGDLPISSKHPFNELDSMILSRFSYLPFSKISMKSKETMASISKKMESFGEDKFMYHGDRDLIINLGKSERFKNLQVTDYVCENDVKSEKQFSAITIHLSSKEIYISYFGTDYTIYAWKEDFNMGFMKNVPCQLAGKKYLERISRKYSTKKIRLGGHSKGGNVAIYAAFTVRPKIQNRIIKIHNFDGPGFNKEIVEKYSNSKVLPRIETYIPQESVVGRLLNHKEKITVVYSTEKGIIQHEIFSWQVMRDSTIKLESNTKNSENIDKTLSEWLENTTPEQRKIFVDTIFELLYSTGSTTLSDLTHNLSSNLLKIMKKYNQISKEDKKVLMQMIKLMAGYYFLISSKKDKKPKKVKKKKTKTVKIKAETA